MEASSNFESEMELSKSEIEDLVVAKNSKSISYIDNLKQNKSSRF